jgi:hypothetical protein
LYLVAQPDEHLTINTIVADTPGGEQELPELAAQSSATQPRPSLRMIVDAALQQLTARYATQIIPAIAVNGETSAPINEPNPTKLVPIVIEPPGQSIKIQHLAGIAITAIVVLALGFWLSSRNGGSPNPTTTAIAVLPTRTPVAASAIPVPSSRATIPSMEPSTAVVLIASATALPINTPTEPPTIMAETATNALQSTQSITIAWELYTDRRVGAEAREKIEPPDDDGAVNAWKRALEASDALIAEATRLLGTADQPLLQYGARMAGPGSWRIDTRLFTSIALLRVGLIDEARQQYLQATKEMNGSAVEPTTQQNIATLNGFIGTVSTNWDIVNTSADTQARAKALREIIATLNGRARNPSNTAQTADSLLAGLLPTATPKPKATPTAPPIVTPARIVVRTIALEELQQSAQAATCPNCNVIITIPDGLTLEISSDTNAPIDKLSSTKASGQIGFDTFYNFVLTRNGTTLPISGNTGFQVDRNKYYSITVTLIQ